MELTSAELLDLGAGARAVGFTIVGDALDSAVSPRGYRLLTKVPRLPPAIVDRLVDHFESLQRLLAANLEDLMSVGGVGESRARAVREGLSRLAESSILERTSDLELRCTRSLPRCPSCTTASTAGMRVERPRRCPGACPGTSAWAVLVSEVMSHQTPVGGSSRSGGSGWPAGPRRPTWPPRPRRGGPRLGPAGLPPPRATAARGGRARSWTVTAVRCRAPRRSCARCRASAPTRRPRWLLRLSAADGGRRHQRPPGPRADPARRGAGRPGHEPSRA